MGEERINRHLHRARERLERIPQRAVEGEWGTNEPLVAETLTVIAHALIAQAEIGQETLRGINALTNRISRIEGHTINYNYRVPYDEIQHYAKDAVKRETESYVKEHAETQPGFYELFRAMFGGRK